MKSPSLASGSPQPGRYVSPKGSASRVRIPKPAGSPRVKVVRTQLRPSWPAPRRLPWPPGPREVAAPGRSRPFRPQDFYLRSSRSSGAGPRGRQSSRPGAGTSRPVVLMPARAHEQGQGARRGSRTPAGGLQARARPARGRPWPAWSRLSSPRSARPEKRLPDSYTSSPGDEAAAGGR